MKKFLSMMLALVLTLALVPSAFAAETVSASDKFEDVFYGWHGIDELNYALANGYISGTSADTFSPDAAITRGQFVTILGRMVNAPTSGGSTKFTDVDAGSWYAPYVAWAAQNGYVNGTSGTTFSPNASITTEQMAVILANYVTKSGVVLSGGANYWPYTDESSVSSWAVSSVELMSHYDLLMVDAYGNINPQYPASRFGATYALVRLAKAIGLGEEPTIVQSEIPIIRRDSVSVQRSNIVQLSDTAETAAKKIHDALWAGGYINSSMTQRQKAAVYFDWLYYNCEYDWTFEFGMESHYAHAALVKGKAVCDGLTKGYNLLLGTEGIKCSTFHDADHMWSSAVLDGVTYYMDNTNDIFAVPQEHAPYLFNDGSMLMGHSPVGNQADYPDTTSWMTACMEWQDLLRNRYHRHYNEMQFEEPDWDNFEYGTLEDGQLGIFDGDGSVLEVIDIGSFGN